MDRILDIFEYLGQVDCQNIVSSLVFNLVKWNKCLSGKQESFGMLCNLAYVKNVSTTLHGGTQLLVIKDGFI